MFSRLLFKVKFRYLFIISIIGIIFTFHLFFLFVIIFFLKIYIKSKKIIYLILLYIFVTFSIFDFLSPKIFSENSNYYTNSNIEYDINKHYGYYPKSNSEFNEEIYFNKKLIKKNIYSINEYGHRENFNLNDKNENCIVLYGGSIIFGQSLSDDETLPYFISRDLNFSHSVYNYGFNGYGPHQFLSKLENNEISEIIHCDFLLLIYKFIPDHVARTAGRRSYGENSPRYDIKNNSLIQRGFFSDYPYKIIMKLRKNIRNSKTISSLYDIGIVNDYDKKIFLKILKKIETEAVKNFKNVSFINIIWYENLGIWNNSKSEFKEIYNFLKSKNHIIIDNLKIDENIKKNNIPGDQHPTKKYNEILSKVIVKIINK